MPLNPKDEPFPWKQLVIVGAYTPNLRVTSATRAA
jgi:hypothetical protein